MSDGHMPHQYPPRPPDSDPVRLDAWADAIAWKCQACPLFARLLDEMTNSAPVQPSNRTTPQRGH